MFAVVEYLNYRKDVQFKFIGYTDEFEKADKYAREFYIEKYLDEHNTIATRVEEECVWCKGLISKYTQGDGYYEMVVGVIEIKKL